MTYLKQWINSKDPEKSAQEPLIPKAESDARALRLKRWLMVLVFFTISFVLITVLFELLFFRDVLANSPGEKAPVCSIIGRNRFDCWPDHKNGTREECEQRGCCWKAATTQGPPRCYFPENYRGYYTASNVKVTARGVTADLTKRGGQSLFPPDINRLRLQVDFHTETRLRVKIFDPENARFEPPIELPSGPGASMPPQYDIKIVPSPFGIVITRKSTGASIFDTRQMAPFIFADQFLQIGTSLSTPYLYGLGEHRFGFLQEIHTWRRLVFWNRDAALKVDNNGYGSHPFYLNLEERTGDGVGNAHGVLLLNSNAGDVALQPAHKSGAITYRFTGGILDFFVLLGDSPLSVSTQYSTLVGPSYMPPFWSLGFHICKYGIKNDVDLRALIERNRNAKMPYDVQWNDIDYMDKHKDFTYSQKNYKDLPSIVEDLHKHKQRNVIMADPAISSSQPAGSYPPFDDGKKLDIFVKNATGEILIGKVWPGETAFPDFFHFNALTYWYRQVEGFHQKVPFDGLWIDMNEPSNFVDGSKYGCPNTSTLDHPPYTPKTIDGGSLISFTICPSAKHDLSAHYNLHNMYGWSQAKVSREALDILYEKRSPLISRSTFVGSGRYTGHWLGDNFSKWSDMAYSVPGILNFNLFGIPLVGADICGFHGNTTAELCTRWHQLGVFYPFMRNHADLFSNYQDPAHWKAPYIDYIRDALKLRYRLLAVLYTAFFNANTKGLPIVRPLFYLYPGTESISSQFMWTDQLLISPVLTEGATRVTAFIPKDTFYDFYTGKPLIGEGHQVEMPAPLSTIPVHIRAGSILPLLPPTERTDDSRLQKFTITVANSTTGLAEGDLFWDDGERAYSMERKFKPYNLIRFKLRQGIISWEVINLGYIPAKSMEAGKFMVLGVPKQPQRVHIDGHGGGVEFLYDPHLQTVEVPDLSLNLLVPQKIVLVF